MKNILSSMTKKQKTLTGLSLVLVTVLIIGATIAYLSSVTEQRANNFTFSSNLLDAKLTEPEWDGVKYYDPDDGVTPIYDVDGEGPVYGYEDGDPSKPLRKGDPKLNDPKNGRPRKDGNGDPIKYGDEEAVHMIPGRVAPKNPIITNTGDLCDAWVTMRITFVYAAGTVNAGRPLTPSDMAKVNAAIEINYNADGPGAKWHRVPLGGIAGDITQTFYYDEVLEKAAMAGVFTEGGKTIPLFTEVRVAYPADNAQIAALDAIGGFAIFIEGYAAQDIVAANAAAFLDWGWNPEGTLKYVRFDNTPQAMSPANVNRPGILPAP